ncbi:growth hormone secretagogue receptor type 1-like [Panulirus ornatus]|uniref:growth hormone secretagogue receptor type 1-like n=1 Tax=Panulirus ornatus TaxID=150431 RepID=UPI003A87EBB3
MVTTELVGYHESFAGYRAEASVMLTPGSAGLAIMDSTSENPYPKPLSSPSYPPLMTIQATNMTEILYTSSDFGGGEHQDNSTSSMPVFPEYIRVVSTVFCCLVFVVGVVGNMLVPVVILKDRDMRNSTNYFLMNLSVADLLVLLICLPPTLVELNSSPDVWVMGDTMCKIVPYVETSVVHASALSLVVISLERYLVICQPLQAGYRCTRAKVITAIVVIWVVAFVSAGPVLRIVQHQRVRFHDGSYKPSCFTPLTSNWTKSFFVISYILFFFTPLLLLVGVYTVIARQLLVDTYELTHKKENPQMRARRQVVIMLATVVLFFFLCLMPLRVFFLWIMAVSNETINSLGIDVYYNLLYFCRVMYYINSSINPILYNMTSTKFRSAFLRVFWGKRSRIQRQHTYSNTSFNNPTVSHNLRLNYGTNCSMVYKTLYSKSVVSNQCSYMSTASSSSQVTRQTSLASSTSSKSRATTKDTFV